ncbi:type II toxin-antitoxin system HicB family antitoxin [uncultured Candidatus Thioglobus sp.]|mgnify:CR=1 FL=1|jgi:predicted HicB family RNase H-like nuclease|uniref:type II toxin-antitoxin system HicB family antitoxin n=1 Tax=uncultured Candidatus Thioglobus sp. TaxID=655186 RepID=UPI0001BD3878|nr:MAG: HicB family protein [uncultured Candidatus Thioglobus sp.]MBT7498885.1 type II toxin-antitoxin system HicB family antitoxin [Candidatus Thioglobus sp.]
MSNIIEYKDYIGSVEYSNEDKCFFGKLEMIDDLVTFEATNVDDLESNFKRSVDDYINTCMELDRDPQKTYKGVFNVRINPDLHKKIYKKALKEHISLNAFIGKTLSEKIKAS